MSFTWGIISGWAVQRKYYTTEAIIWRPQEAGSSLPFSPVFFFLICYILVPIASNMLHDAMNLRNGCRCGSNITIGQPGHVPELPLVHDAVCTFAVQRHGGEGLERAYHRHRRSSRRVWLQGKLHAAREYTTPYGAPALICWSVLCGTRAWAVCFISACFLTRRSNFFSLLSSLLFHYHSPTPEQPSQPFEPKYQVPFALRPSPFFICTQIRLLWCCFVALCKSAHVVVLACCISNVRPPPSPLIPHFIRPKL